MSTLGRWLADILNAHIERHNVPVAEPVPDTPLARHYIRVLDEPLKVYTSAKPLLDEIAGYSWEPTARPCWACGDPGGFHSAHDCDTHFDTTGGAARRAPAAKPAPLTVLGGDIEPSHASTTWRRT